MLSFTMLTVNADEHPMMQQFHKLANEKRMVVILPEEQYGDWLAASPSESMDFMRLYPAEKLATLAQQEVKRATSKTKAAPDLFGQ